jgi:hypothetical protein
MTNEMIEKYLSQANRKNGVINIHFKQRNAVKGLFIRSKDYDELKSKNFWRIVTAAKFKEWESTHDEALARIFNGAEFTRLSDN